MPQILWTNYFLVEQGYNIRDTIIYQDNKSAILLEKNGRLSSSKRTKHIKARYFFVKDYQARKEVKIKHCTTDNMIADFFTKPLQGDKFRKFRKEIMNLQQFGYASLYFTYFMIIYILFMRKREKKTNQQSYISYTTGVCWVYAAKTQEEESRIYFIYIYMEVYQFYESDESKIRFL